MARDCQAHRRGVSKSRLTDWRPVFGLLFQFCNRFRPIILEQFRQASVGEQFAFSLTPGTIVCFVLRVANPLHGCSAVRAWQPITTMNGHLRAECSDVLWEVIAGLSTQQIAP